jgi:hypothetical protein
MIFSPALPVKPMHHNDMTNPARPKRTQTTATISKRTDPIEPEPIPLINDFNPFPVVPEAVAVVFPNALLDAGGGFGGGVAGIFPPDGGGADAGAGFDDGAGPEPDILILYRGISGEQVVLLPR